MDMGLFHCCNEFKCSFNRIISLEISTLNDKLGQVNQATGNMMALTAQPIAIQVTNLNECHVSAKNAANKAFGGVLSTVAKPPIVAPYARIKAWPLEVLRVCHPNYSTLSL